MYKILCKKLPQDVIEKIIDYTIDKEDYKAKIKISYYHLFVHKLKYFNSTFFDINYDSMYDTYIHKLQLDMKFILLNKYSIIKNCMVIFHNTDICVSMAKHIKLSMVKKVYSFLDKSNNHKLIFDRRKHLRKDFFKLLLETDSHKLLTGFGFKQNFDYDSSMNPLFKILKGLVVYSYDDCDDWDDCKRYDVIIQT
jgi:hypothetical protein